MQSRTRVCDAEIYSCGFDQIPDSLVLIVLNKLADIRSLGRCSAVCRRLNSLVPLVQDVYIKIDEVVTINGDNDESPYCSSHKPRNFFSNILKYMFFSLIKPFHNMRNSNNTNKTLLPQVSQSTLDQVLKNFHYIQNLWIELPGADVCTEDGVVLKWKAEFGSTLQNCVILGGTQIDLKPVAEQGLLEDNGIPESFYTNGGLKLRVVWTISSLIAASTRHYLLEPIIRDHPTLKTVVFTDADGQGTLSMSGEQLREFKEKPLAASASSKRTQVPASNMKLRYAPYLELPEGIGMQGATLVAIKPSGEGSGTSKKEVEAFVSGAFDGPFKAAVKTLVKRRTYLLEMNGF
ncbi:F-box protein At4g18380-like [Macadamia integrifolia]|uniref:F-box protein At4g18380-like n=1 Tax=Macadamia integrifolia TaxID=60698 RepID=UPI001C4F12C2|nr:F-box protein At4g18380-like [Macadamia integrifolia]XP_042515899.1 F-box protein At4g18380-like [Macadamia integrifolia]XP_042515900.1 F-box protein At4g18380-like [Macadamia integrifolia]XP_042515901.1 F-box protein At4g18380-like [Macadamia integrifolia]XP_042515902.1 F-box protein At4g18380-like [Macadamia integrifolia]XP_042515903.1 F-box protein At4g18380-like [Macadamia integrifolia]XP_042515904.1 F-box protein At4g18380-like [Macadamia integrifolia]